jgi:small subunit ribosomal protein S5e
MSGFATEPKLFGKWSFEECEVKDISLEDYIACKPKYAQFLPHSQGRWQKKRFRKAQCPIVERLVCSMMRYGRNNGKKLMAVRIVKHSFEIIHLLTDQNPVQVYVDAVINCGPREDSTRVGGGGAVRRQACDVSPLRRVNNAIYLMTTGAREASFRNIKTIAECLADEIMNAAKVRACVPRSASQGGAEKGCMALVLTSLTLLPLDCRVHPTLTLSRRRTRSSVSPSRIGRWTAVRRAWSRVGRRIPARRGLLGCRYNVR